MLHRPGRHTGAARHVHENCCYGTQGCWGLLLAIGRDCLVYKSTTDHMAYRKLAQHVRLWSEVDTEAFSILQKTHRHLLNDADKSAYEDLFKIPDADVAIAAGSSHKMGHRRIVIWGHC